MIYFETPKGLDRVKVRGIRGHVGQTHLCVGARDVSAHSLTVVCGQTVQDYQRQANDTLLKLAQELDDLRDPDRTLENFVVELQKRRLPHWCPSAHPFGRLTEPALGNLA